MKHMDHMYNQDIFHSRVVSTWPKEYEIIWWILYWGGWGVEGEGGAKGQKKKKGQGNAMQNDREAGEEEEEEG